MTTLVPRQREWTFRRIVAELPFIPATSNWFKLLCSLLAEPLMFVSSLCIIAETVLPGASIGVQAVESDIVYASSDAKGNFSVTLTIDPRTNDFGPTTIHINLVNTTDGSKNLMVQGELTIIK